MCTPYAQTRIYYPFVYKSFVSYYIIQNLPGSYLWQMEIRDSLDIFHSVTDSLSIYEADVKQSLLAEYR